MLGLPETFRTPREGAPEHVEMSAGGFVVAVSTAESALRDPDGTLVGLVAKRR